MATRLVRGAFRKDFRDRFDVELALFEFTVAFERMAQQMRDPDGERERLLDEVRSRVLANPRAADRRRCPGRRARHEPQPLQPLLPHANRPVTGAVHDRGSNPARPRALLVATRAPLKQIATDWGFANANHFGKVFRRFQHQSPAVYRRAIG